MSPDFGRRLRIFSRANDVPVVSESVSEVLRWDEFCMSLRVTTIDENEIGFNYAVPRRVVQRSSALLVL
jgi:hypothetical protein